jgi:hypothetical protein
MVTEDVLSVFGDRIPKGLQSSFGISVLSARCPSSVSYDICGLWLPARLTRPSMIDGGCPLCGIISGRLIEAISITKQYYRQE